MGTSTTRSWVLGTAALAVVILVAAWFLAVSPKLAEAAETRLATEDERARQDIMQARLVTLRDQFERLDEYEAELAGVRAQVPDKAQLALYVGEIHDRATAHGVTVTAVNPGVPTVVAAPVADAAATTPGTTTEVPPADVADAGTEPSADPAAAPVAQAVTHQLVAVPMSISVVGAYANVTAFLQGLQTETARLLLVTSLNGVALEATAAAGGRPATAPGDLELAISGMLFVVPPQEVAPGAAPQEPEAEPVPLPTTERNPFSPVTG